MDTKTLLDTVRANIAREQAEQAVNAAELATWQALEAALIATPAQNRAPLPIPAFSLPEGVVGVAYSAQLPDTTDPDGDPVGYIAAGLAPGLSLSGKLITGTPTQAGTYSPTFLASDGKLQSAVTSVSQSIKAPVVVVPPSTSGLEAIAPSIKDGFLTPQSKGGSLTGKVEYSSPGIAAGIPEWFSEPIRLNKNYPSDFRPVTIKVRQNNILGKSLIGFDLVAAIKAAGTVTPGDKPTTDPVIVPPIINHTLYESLLNPTD